MDWSTCTYEELRLFNVILSEFEQRDKGYNLGQLPPEISRLYEPMLAAYTREMMKRPRIRDEVSEDTKSLQTDLNA